jgi:hypothetical protein
MPTADAGRALSPLVMDATRTVEELLRAEL